MAEVFISYSRKDTDVVRRLAIALEQQGRHPWVDWERVRPAERFIEAIREAIEAADTFVFVVSPDSIGSQVCGDELGHAMKHNKRLIPMVCRDAARSSIPPSLAVLDWILVRETDDFALGVGRLISALDTDLAWVRTHTHLGLRAEAWNNRNRSRSLLLAGDDLRAAERTIAQSAGKQPQLTELQQAYVFASRQQATYSLRLKFATAIGALVATSVLAGIAYWNYRLAERRTRVSSAQRLAAEARRVSDESPQLGLLLAVEAQYISQRAHDPTVPEVTTTLLNSLTRVGGVPLDGGAGKIEFASVSPGGHWLVSRSLDSFKLRDLSSGDLSAPSIDIQGQDGSAHAVSPRGAWLATAETKAIRLWDLTKPTPQRDGLTIAAEDVTELLFSPDEGRVAYLAGGVVRICQIAEVKRQGACPRALKQSSPTTSMAFTRGGAELVTGDEAGIVDAWSVNLDTKERLSLGTFSKAIEQLAVSSDGRWIVVESSKDPDARSEDISVIDRRKSQRAPIRRLSEDGPALGYVAFSPNGRTLAYSTDSFPRAPALYVVDLEARAADSKPHQLIGHSQKVTAMTFAPDGETLITASEDRTVRIWKLGSSDGGTNPLVLHGHEEGVVSLALSNDGRRLATGGRDDTIRLWNLRRGDPNSDVQVLRGSESPWPGTTYGVFYLAFSAHDDWLFGGGPANALRAWGLASGDLGTLPYSMTNDRGQNIEDIDANQWTVKRRQGNRLIVEVAASGVADLSSVPVETGRPDEPDGPPSLDTDEPEGGVAAAAPGPIRELCSQGRTWCIRIGADGGELRQPSRPAEVIRLPLGDQATVKFSADGRWMAAADGQAETCHLWDLNHPRRPPRILSGTTGEDVQSFAISPDGERFAILSSAPSLLVWDISSSDSQVVRVNLGNKGYQTVGFSADGRWVARKTFQGPAYAWPLDAPDLLRAARATVGRNLTFSEWESYFVHVKYRRTFDDLPFPDDEGRAAQR